MDSDLFALDSSDESLVQQFQYGDLTAFNTLYERYEKEIYRKIFSIVANAQDAEDIHSEMFWKVYQLLFDLRLEHSFKLWLFTVARNSSIDHVRKRNRKEHSISLDSIEGFSYDQSPSPEEQVLAEEQTREVLQQLKPGQRDVLLLHMYGCTSDEIAHILTLKVSSVHTLVSNVRRTIRQLYPFSIRHGRRSKRQLLLGLFPKKKASDTNDC